MHPMHNDFRGDVIFAPDQCGHAARFAVDGHDVELIAARALNWRDLESQQVAMLVGALHMDGRLARWMWTLDAGTASALAGGT